MARKKAEIHFQSCHVSGNIYWILGAVRMQMQKEDDYYLSQADIIIKNYPPFSLEDEIEQLF